MSADALLQLDSSSDAKSQDRGSSSNPTQCDWEVFATTCYAFGRLERRFDSPIDEHLLAIVRRKLDEGRKLSSVVQDDLESLVRSNWARFMSSSGVSLQVERDFKLNPTEESAIHRNEAARIGSSAGCSQTTASNRGLDEAAQMRKVYLGGLSHQIGERELREHFKQFGAITRVSIIAHKDTGKRRGFGFIEFGQLESVERVVSEKFHSVIGRQIEAKKAIAKVELSALKRKAAEQLASGRAGRHNGAVSKHKRQQSNQNLKQRHRGFALADILGPYLLNNLAAAIPGHGPSYPYQTPAQPQLAPPPPPLTSLLQHGHPAAQLHQQYHFAASQRGRSNCGSGSLGGPSER